MTIGSKLRIAVLTAFTALSVAGGVRTAFAANCDDNRTTATQDDDCKDQPRGGHAFRGYVYRGSSSGSHAEEGHSSSAPHATAESPHASGGGVHEGGGIHAGSPHSGGGSHGGGGHGGGGGIAKLIGAGGAAAGAAAAKKKRRDR